MPKRYTYRKATAKELAGGSTEMIEILVEDLPDEIISDDDSKIKGSDIDFTDLTPKQILILKNKLK